jgi:hypothetical protein
MQFRPNTAIVPGPLTRAVNVNTGGKAGGWFPTSMTTDWLTVPPGPVQASEYVAVASSGPSTSIPLVALGPRHVLPAAPTFDAVQLVASDDDHVSVDSSPGWTLVGFALRVTVGGGAGVLVNAAVTVVEPVSITTQGPVPPHADHPSNADPDAGVAVRATAVPASKSAEHTLPQSIPAGEHVTAPMPDPARLTESMTTVGPGGGGGGSGGPVPLATGCG